MRFHINSKTGKVSKCRATKRPCPLSGGSYSSLTDAREALEAREVHAHTAAKLQSKVVETELSTVMDTELLKKMIDEGFIITQTHPDDPSMKVMSYSRTAQISGRWNDATTQARGLIIKSEKDDFSDAVILERPWRKFFTLSQMTGSDGKKAWALGDEDDGPQNMTLASVDSLDFDAPAEVTDKMDGSLGILYRGPDGKLALATKGRFDSDQAIAYTKMLQNNPKYYEAAERLKKENPNTTFLYELVGRDNQIVLQYEEDDITFTGAVDVNTGMYRSTSEFSDVWSKEKGLQSAETMKANSLREALSLPDRKNREGVVVRIASKDPNKQVLVKIKQDDYLRMHRLLSSVSKAGTRDAIRESTATIGDLIEIGRSGDVRKLDKINEALVFFQEGGTPLHQRLHDEQRRNFEEAILPKARTLSSAFEQVQSMPESRFSGDEKQIMKEFAAEIKDRDSFEKSMLFNFFGARLRGEDGLAKNGSNILGGMARDF